MRVNTDQAHEIIEAGATAAQDCGCGCGEDGIIAAALREMADMTAPTSVWTAADLFALAALISPDDKAGPTCTHRWTWYNRDTGRQHCVNCGPL